MDEGDAQRLARLVLVLSLHSDVISVFVAHHRYKGYSVLGLLRVCHVLVKGRRHLYYGFFERLQEALTHVNALAANGELPDAEIQAGVLKVTPLTNDVPEKADELMRQAYYRILKSPSCYLKSIIDWF
jgi:hypothetical protein